MSLAIGLAPALAQSPQQSSKKGGAVAETVRQWGLLGIWSVECGRPPGGNHIHIGYVEWMGGKVMTERDYGDPRRNDSNEITDATINPDGSLTLVADFQSLGGQIRTFALMRDRPDRLRAIWNRGPDGAYSVKDGRFTGNGNETPWQYKCR
ncbi:MAG: hypothetical protein KF889_06665 [Alphaproteobacteria bacterium]|nr:hypothetical protein [Alphaproteobacteria bacterium]MCW5740501.1 hypothetical protein [Alphaproteobacteria bacterium]